MGEQDENRLRICTSPSGGSPRLKYVYRSTMCDEMVDWFKAREKVCDDEIDNYGKVQITARRRPPTFQEFGTERGIPMYVLELWGREHPGFAEAMKKCRDSMQVAGWDWCRSPGCAKQAQFYLQVQCGVGMTSTNTERPNIRIFEAGQAPEPMDDEVEVEDGDD